MIVYRMLAALRLELVDDTRHHALRALQLAQTVQQQPYVAAARVCNAWVEWRGGNAERAESLATKALEIWTAHSHPYPFQWTALFPLLDIQMAGERFEAAKALLTRLLHPSQQALPKTLADSDLTAALTIHPGTSPGSYHRTILEIFCEPRDLFATASFERVHALEHPMSLAYGSYRSRIRSDCNSGTGRASSCDGFRACIRVWASS